ncbi:hypothetical protein IWQ57_000697, partial [Coemansia nantahalensis]
HRYRRHGGSDPRGAARARAAVLLAGRGRPPPPLPDRRRGRRAPAAVPPAPLPAPAPPAARQLAQRARCGPAPPARSLCCRSVGKNGRV